MIFPFQLCQKQQPTDKPVPNATLQVTGAVGWRREGLVYKKNEVIDFSYFSFTSLLNSLLDYEHFIRAGLLGYCGKCKSSYVF